MNVLFQFTIEREGRGNPRTFSAPTQRKIGTVKFFLNLRVMSGQNSRNIRMPMSPARLTPVLDSVCFQTVGLSGCV